MHTYYADDFEFTVRARSCYSENTHKIVDLMEELASLASKSFTSAIDMNVSRYDRNHPESVVAVTIGPFGIRFRIFSQGKRLQEMFAFLIDVERRVKDADCSSYKPS
jgi:hypothetical protein